MNGKYRNIPARTGEQSEITARLVFVLLKYTKKNDMHLEGTKLRLTTGGHGNLGPRPDKGVHVQTEMLSCSTSKIMQ